MLAVFERRILCRIFGGALENSVWRIRTNRELTELFDSTKVLEELRARRLQWLGHVARMPSTRDAARAWEIQHRGSQPLGRPRCRWADKSKEDLRASGLEADTLRTLANDRAKWRSIVQEARSPHIKSLSIPIKTKTGM